MKSEEFRESRESKEQGGWGESRKQGEGVKGFGGVRRAKGNWGVQEARGVRGTK